MSNLPDQGYYWIFHIKDHFSKYSILRPLKSKHAHAVLQELQLWIAFFGPPRMIQCDNGREFKGAVKVFLKDHNILLVHGAPRHPQSQGLVKQSNAVVKRKLQALMEEKGTHEWSSLLLHVMLAMNSQLHEVLRQSPYEVVFNHSMRSYQPPPSIALSRSASPACSLSRAARASSGSTAALAAAHGQASGPAPGSAARSSSRASRASSGSSASRSAPRLARNLAACSSSRASRVSSGSSAACLASPLAAASAPYSTRRSAACAPPYSTRRLAASSTGPSAAYSLSRTFRASSTSSASSAAAHASAPGPASGSAACPASDSASCSAVCPGGHSNEQVQPEAHKQYNARMQQVRHYTAQRRLQMANRYNTRVQPTIFDIGQTVALRIPKEDRLIVDNRLVFCLVIGKPHADCYKLQTHHGVLNRLYSTRNMQAISPQLHILEAIEFNPSLPTISLQTAIRLVRIDNEVLILQFVL